MDLDVPVDNPVARQIAGRGHPNLVVLDRPDSDDGKRKMSVIPIDSVRRVSRFLGSTAAGGNWRIVIVDAADDMNRSSANALLKMLEEPPRRTLFLLISHIAGRLLPTIRSRCRRLKMYPLDQAQLAAVLDLANAGESAEDRNLASHMAHGSVGRALELATEEGADIARSMLAALDDLPRVDAVRLHGLAERLGRRGADDAYALATSLMLDWISASGRDLARSGAPPALLAPWSEVWEKVSRALAEAEIYNLDRTQTLLSAFRTVSAAAVHDAAA